MDLKTFKGLLGQYFQDAAPGGLLNPEVPPGGPTELAKGLLGFTPGVGDAISAYDAVQSARQGDWAGAALNGVGVLPFVPSMAAAIKPIYHGTSPEAAKKISKNGFSLRQSADGGIWFTSNPEIGEVGAAAKGAVVKRMLDDEKLKLGGWKEYDQLTTDEMIARGFDGLALPDGGETVYKIWNHQKLNRK